MLKQHYKDLAKDSRKKIKFMENLSHTTFVTGENKGQAIVLVDHNQDEIEVSLDDIQIALTTYYRRVIAGCNKTIKSLEDEENGK